MGVAIGRSRAPIPDIGVPPLRTWTSDGLSANGRTQENACRNDARSESGVSGVGRSTLALCRRGVGSVAAWIISSIGVMPAIGSLENCPREYDTAPTSRPSIYTGL